MEDELSDVLRLIRLKSCVYFARSFWAPWAMRLEGGAVAQFHVVLRGPCVFEAAGRVFQAAPGDVFLFPRGEAHVLADSPGRDAVAGSDFMGSLQAGRPLFAEGEMATELICGHYEYRNDTGHPLIDELPAVIHVKSFETYAPETLRSVLPALIRELKSESPGASVVTEKLAEVLLVQVIRAHFAQERQSQGFLAGLFEPRLVRAFRLIHGQFDRDLSLEDLAAAARMSRSAFAQHFKTTVGQAPIAYLTRWRMCRAHELLQDQGMTVSRVAFKVGYESDIAFSRAFKRQFGRSPSAFRRKAQAPAESA